MPFLEILLPNDKTWGIGVGELIISVNSLEGMSAEDIGNTVLNLIPDILEVQPYFQAGYSFSTLEDFKIFKKQEK